MVTRRHVSTIVCPRQQCILFPPISCESCAATLLPKLRLHFFAIFCDSEVCFALRSTMPLQGLTTFIPSIGGFVDPDRPSPMGKDDARIIIYGYNPSVPLSIMGIIFFTIALAIHAVQVAYYRFWSFLPLVFACLMEVIGYVFRFLSGYTDPYNIIYFVVVYFFIVTAPVLISASIYVCLTMLLRWARIERSIAAKMRPKLILWIFITADIITTVIQVTGAALIGSQNAKMQDPTTAHNILIAGLALQSFTFVIFLCLYAWFTYSIAKIGLVGKKLPFLVALAVSSLLVFVRTLLRLAETSQGIFGNLRSHEVYFGCLEFAPIVLAVGLLAAWHPARWVGSSQEDVEQEDSHELVTKVAQRVDEHGEGKGDAVANVRVMDFQGYNNSARSFHRPAEVVAFT